MRITAIIIGAATLITGMLISFEASAHGWHRTCRHGLTDVHKHVKGVGRTECTTRRCTTNSMGFKRCVWS